MKTIWPVGAAALAVLLAPAARAADTEKPVHPPRVYGPAPPPATPRRNYGPQPEPTAVKASAKLARPAGGDVTVKVAARTESRKMPAKGEEPSLQAAGSADMDRIEKKSRAVTIYFVHGEEKQSTLEFALPGTEGNRGIEFGANNTEADVNDGKLLLRGDVRIRFSNGLQLSAQLVSVTVHHDGGPLEIIVKE